MNRISKLFIAAVFILGISSPAAAQDSPLRLGIIGTDSSHSVEFTRILNDSQAKDHVSGALVVAAYRGGNPNLTLSRDRIEGFTHTLQTRWKLPFVSHITDLCSKVDGLLLLSVDAGSRLKELREAAACNKPIFIDKPLADTLPHAIAIAAFLKEHHVRWFSTSALRFGHQTSIGKIMGADVWGPGALGDAPALDLAWYGIHSIEALYSFMGPGVATVTRVHTSDSDLITATWSDGRIGTLRLIRPDSIFGATLFGRDRSVTQTLEVDYGPLLSAIVHFMNTGQPPVSNKETLEIFQFMDAAQRSADQRGVPIRLTNRQQY